MPKLNQKGFITQLFIFLLLLAGLGVGIYLVQNRTGWFSKAAPVTPQTPETSFELEAQAGTTEPFADVAVLKGVSVGQRFRVDIWARSDIDPANLFVAKIKFPTDSLKVVEINKRGANSFVNQWIADPSFDNSSGDISIIGGVNSPGLLTSTQSAGSVKGTTSTPTAGVGTVSGTRSIKTGESVDFRADLVNPAQSGQIWVAKSPDGKSDFTCPGGIVTNSSQEKWCKVAEGKGPTLSGNFTFRDWGSYIVTVNAFTNETATYTGDSATQCSGNPLSSGPSGNNSWSNCGSGSSFTLGVAPVPPSSTTSTLTPSPASSVTPAPTQSPTLMVPRLMASIIFEAKKAGNANIEFTDGSQILRNSDSLNIISAKKGLKIPITAVSCDLGMFIKFQDITSNGPAQKYVDLSLRQPGTSNEVKHFEGVPAKNDVSAYFSTYKTGDLYRVGLGNMECGTYDIYINSKGYNEKKFPSIVVDSDPWNDPEAYIFNGSLVSISAMTGLVGPYFVKPYLVYPADKQMYPEYETAVKNYLVELQSWYKQKIGVTFNMAPLQVVKSSENYLTMRCGQNPSQACLNDPSKLEGNVGAYANKAIHNGVEQWEEKTNALVFAAGAGGFAGGNKSTNDTGFAITGDWVLEPISGVANSWGIPCKYSDGWQCAGGVPKGSPAHELGHAFGLPHPGTQYRDQTIMEWHGGYPTVGLLPQEVDILKNSPFFKTQTSAPGQALTCTNIAASLPLGKLPSGEDVYVVTGTKTIQLGVNASPLAKITWKSAAGTTFSSLNSNPSTLTASANGSFEIGASAAWDNSAVTANCPNVAISFQSAGQVTPSPTPSPATGQNLRHDGDINGDGKVNLVDMSRLLAQFGQSGQSEADLNADGIINSLDVLKLRSILVKNGTLK